MSDLKSIIETAFENRASISPTSVDASVKAAVNDALAMLDSGEARVAEKLDGEWVVNQWLKKAVLLSFRINDNAPIEGQFTQYYDKVPSKFANMSADQFKEREELEKLPKGILSYCMI